jgi:hypothetical protein
LPPMGTQSPDRKVLELREDTLGARPAQVVHQVVAVETGPVPAPLDQPGPDILRRGVDSDRAGGVQVRPRAQVIAVHRPAGLRYGGAPPEDPGTDPADLLHVQMRHVTRPAGDDLAGLAVAVTAEVDEPALTKSESGQVAGDGAAVDSEVQLGQFVGDPVGRPLLLPPPGLDPLNARAGVASGLWCGVEGRSCRPSSLWRRHRLTHFDAHARPGNGHFPPCATPATRAVPRCSTSRPRSVPSSAASRPASSITRPD